MADDAEGDVFDGDDPFDDIEARLSRISDHLDDPFDEQAHPDAPARLAGDAGELDRLMERIKQRARVGSDRPERTSSRVDIRKDKVEKPSGELVTESTETADVVEEISSKRRRPAPSKGSAEVAKSEVDWLSAGELQKDLLPESTTVSVDGGALDDHATDRVEEVAVSALLDSEGPNRADDLWDRPPDLDGPNKLDSPSRGGTGSRDAGMSSVFIEHALFGVEGTDRERASTHVGNGPPEPSQTGAEAAAPKPRSQNGPQPSQDVLWATGPQPSLRPDTNATGRQTSAVGTGPKPENEPKRSTGLFYTLGGITLIVLSVLLFANMFLNQGGESGEVEEPVSDGVALVTLRNCTEESAHVSISNTGETALVVELRIRFSSGNEIYYDDTTEAGPIAAGEVLTTTVLLSADDIPAEYVGQMPEDCSVDVVSTTRA